jgi:hypothetical protein
MTEKKVVTKILDNHIDCFGEFDHKDEICKKKCVLSIKCCIEKKQTQQMLFSDEIFGTEDNSLLIQ